MFIGNILQTDSLSDRSGMSEIANCFERECF